jgi:hypothetical protein
MRQIDRFPAPYSVPPPYRNGLTLAPERACGLSRFLVIGIARAGCFRARGASRQTVEEELMGYGDNRYGGDRSQGRGEGGGRSERERSSYGDWGSDRDSGHRNQGGGDNDQGFFERAGEQVRSWFSDDDDRGGGNYQERGRSGGQGSDWGRGGASFGGGFGNQRGWGDDHFDRQFGSDRSSQAGERSQSGPGQDGSRDRTPERYDEQSGPTGGRSSYGGGGGGAEPWGGSGFGGPVDNGRRFDRIDPGHVGAQGAHPMSSPVDSGYGGGYGISAGGAAGSSAARYAALGGGGQRHIDTAKLLGDDRGGGRQAPSQSSGQAQGQRSSYGGSQHDPHYSQWRQRQIESLDKDYEDYCREHQSRFEQEFGGWREKRQTQRQHLGRVAPQMEVIGSDGERLGTVDRVGGDRIILTKDEGDAGGASQSIPCSWVENVDERVTLSKSVSEAKSHWHSEEQNRALFEPRDQGSDGPHMLNRSFSGTYGDGDGDGNRGR